MSIAITGIGVISAIGNGVEENLTQLKLGQSGIEPIKGLAGIRKDYLGGQVKLSNDDLKIHLNIDQNQSIPRSALLAMFAAKEAWGSNNPTSGLRIGLINATSVGGMDLSEQFYSEFKNTGSLDKIESLATHDNGASTEILSDYIGIKSNIYTISTACSSAANAILLGARLIKAGELDQVLVGGGDGITNFTLNGFDSLSIYDTEFCRPFDDNRKGLNLGEGAGFIVLESEHALTKTNNTVLAKLAGWGNSNDSFHQTASSPEGKGAKLAMMDALAIAKLNPADIDYINAHGTATPNNDASESAAIHAIFGADKPPFSSTKAFTGHTLAAAGGIEAVYSVLAIQSSLIFPNLNYTTRMKENDFDPITVLTEKKLNHIVSNSFGFGGNSSSLIFSS